MKNNLEVIAFAQQYLWDNLIKTNEFIVPKVPTLQDVKLNRSLQYLLCGYVDRMIKQFGEVTRRDVVGYIENWIAIQGTNHGHEEPFERNHP